LGIKKQETCCTCECNGLPKEQCRYYIDYEKDDNCCLVAIEKNDKMTLKQISERLGISLVRVSQIEKKALSKLYKKIKI
tara:strand:- start:766 stop:1002 length:237 start_codon:yes stop_codon:yes gene_type:complete